MQAARVTVQPLNLSGPTLSPQDPSQADSGVVFKESCLWVVVPETRNKQRRRCRIVSLWFSLEKQSSSPYRPPSTHSP